MIYGIRTTVQIKSFKLEYGNEGWFPFIYVRSLCNDFIVIISQRPLKASFNFSSFQGCNFSFFTTQKIHKAPWVICRRRRQSLIQKLHISLAESFKVLLYARKKLQVRCMSWSPKDYVNDYYFKRVLHTISKSRPPFFKFAISKPEICIVDLVVGTLRDF